MSSPFDPFSLPLPVTEIIPAVRERLAAHNTLIVTAPPGAGKSTLLPLALLDAPWLAAKKIIVLEPRRLAASSIANRMADLLGEQAGETVGYRIRFETNVSRKTRIEVVTEGILTRMLQRDNALEDVGIVIFDEFHERSIHADTALALSREVQDVLRPDLRLLIMSATLDAGQLSAMLAAPVVESKGKLYPVDVIYTNEQDIRQIPELCARTIGRAVKEQAGDILAFLPGQAEIRKCAALIDRKFAGVTVYSLYGQLSHAEQRAALQPDPGGRRKIVLATSIAETSLTIEGIRVVVDSGYTRKSVFDHGTGLSGLRTVPVSADSADQRAGRAGRLAPGACYRMWSTATQQRLAPYRTPEILESDLAPLLLDLLEWGISDIASLCWLDLPPPGAVAAARELLNALGATVDDKITAHGKALVRVPTHPRLANMLLVAQRSGMEALAADIAALLEERDPLDPGRSGADLNLRIEQLRRYRQDHRRDRTWERIEKTAAAYRKLFHTAADKAVPDHNATGLLLAYAYPERIATAKEGNAGQFQLANGQSAVVDRDDDLANERWLTIAQLDAQKGQGKIFLAAPLNPADVIQLASETENIRWDGRKQALLATADHSIGSIVLQSKPLATPNQEKVDVVLAEAIRTNGRILLDFDDRVSQWQNRVLSLRQWNPEQDWPDVGTDALLQTASAWLGPYFAQLRKADDFKRINLADVLQHSLSYDQQRLLAELAPPALVVPSGSLIKLEYSPYGEAPLLAVRLQELFGMLDTPRVNNGAKSMVIQLLSPGYKPVQVTTDLRSFWDNTYFEVRKELKRRYPKHSWPDDPLLAPAVRGVKRK